MADRSSLITIDQLVRSILFKEGKNNDDYLRYKQIVCDGLRHMHIHDFNVIATRVVTVDSTTKTFNYPTDYVRYESVSTVHDGRWWTYTRDERLVPLKDDTQTSIQDSMPNVANNTFATSFSDGGGYNHYYFKPDDKNRRMIVSGFDADTVVLRYVSNGLNTSGDVNVPDYAALALEAYVRWRMSAYEKEPVYIRRENESDYKEARLEMRKVNLPTADEIYDSIYKTTGQGPRR